MQRVSLRAPRKIADRKEVQRVQELADRLGIERPRIIWARQVREAERRLLERLERKQQPSLFDEVSS